MEKKRCIEAELQKTYVRWRWLLIFVWVISFTEVGLMWWVMYNLHNGHAIIVSLVFIVTVFLPVWLVWIHRLLKTKLELSQLEREKLAHGCKQQQQEQQRDRELGRHGEMERHGELGDRLAVERDQKETT